ncbi:MAG: T9SS type A sorting domain-containing protein [Bacteroidota bacterium]
MKKLKKTIHFCLLTYSLLLTIKKSEAQSISNHFFGVNAWMTDTIGDVNACIDPPCIRYGKLHKNWAHVKTSGASIVRFGGISPDRNRPTNFQYIRMIDSIRGKGMEPIMQVPFFNYRYTAQQAADIVHYINVVKGRNIKYWIIGNEPNLLYGYTTAAQIAVYFKAFASAMKNIDPSILIIGPETASFKQTITNGLTTPGGPDDITGKDAAGRYYLDVFSFHTYPLGAGGQTRAEISTNLTAPGALQDDLIYLKNRLDAASSYHNRTGTKALKMAITEASINYTNDAADNLYGLCTNSFVGGQFVSEMYGIGMKCGVDFINLWSVIEGNSNTENCGYIDPFTGNKKPIYYHFKLMADNFSGNSVNCTTNKIEVKSFGSQNSQNTSVMILNEDLTNNYNYTVKLNSDAILGNIPLKINVNSGIAAEYSDVIPSQSTVVLTFNAAGTIIKKCEYSLAGQAINNLPPVCTDFITTGIETNVYDDNIKLDVNVFPNPSSGKFTIELNKKYREEKQFKIEIVNILGQKVYQTKSTFLNGKEEIEITENIAQGAYIISVKEDDNDNNISTKRIIVNK